jgi:hypothetical protein
LPREEFVFSLSGTVLYDEYWERNQSPIQQLNLRFQVASGALVAQILFWSLAISGTLG